MTSSRLTTCQAINKLMGMGDRAQARLQQISRALVQLPDRSRWELASDIITALLYAGWNNGGQHWNWMPPLPQSEAEAAGANGAGVQKIILRRAQPVRKNTGSTAARRTLMQRIGQRPVQPNACAATTAATTQHGEHGCRCANQPGSTDASTAQQAVKRER
jgi:hypothetical protein